MHHCDCSDTIHSVRQHNTQRPTKGNHLFTNTYAFSTETKLFPFWAVEINFIWFRFISCQMVCCLVSSLLSFGLTAHSNTRWNVLRAEERIKGASIGGWKASERNCLCSNRKGKNWEKIACSGSISNFTQYFNYYWYQYSIFIFTFSLLDFIKGI